MLKDDTQPNRTARLVAVSALVLALVGGLSSFNQANAGTEPPAVTQPAAVVTTSCSGFDSDAHKLFDQGESAALRGTFAPGDHVHLAIDFAGVGYAWELTGVLGKMPNVSFRWYSWFTWFSKSHTHAKITRTPASGSTPASTVTVSNGTISGFARWEVEIDVATAGEGAITISKSGADQTSLPFFKPPRVAIARCSAAKTA